MKRLGILSGIFITLISTVTGQTYLPADEGSSVKFAIRNLGITVDGSFKGLKGTIDFNVTNLTASFFNVSVDAATVNTGNGSRDGHLKKEDYFNAASYPQINIVSSKITAGSTQNTFVFAGTVKIKGVTKSISFPFTATPAAGGYTFTGSFKLNRRDFKVGGSSLVLSDNLTVNLKVYAKRK